MDKAHGGRIKFQQPMDGFGLKSGGFTQTFRGTSGWGTEEYLLLSWPEESGEYW